MLNENRLRLLLLLFVNFTQQTAIRLDRTLIQKRKLIINTTQIYIIFAVHAPGTLSSTKAISKEHINPINLKIFWQILEFRIDPKSKNSITD